MNWISVEDKSKLPEHLEDVLFTDGINIFKGYRLVVFLGSSGIDYWYSNTDNRIPDVTHWMLLPELPK